MSGMKDDGTTLAPRQPGNMRRLQLVRYSDWMIDCVPVLGLVNSGEHRLFDASVRNGASL
jgi:hypothetical protein